MTGQPDGAELVPVLVPGKLPEGHRHAGRLTAIAVADVLIDFGPGNTEAAARLLEQLQAGHVTISRTAT